MNYLNQHPLSPLSFLKRIKQSQTKVMLNMSKIIYLNRINNQRQGTVGDDDRSIWLPFLHRRQRAGKSNPQSVPIIKPVPTSKKNLRLANRLANSSDAGRGIDRVAVAGGSHIRVRRERCCVGARTEISAEPRGNCDRF